MSAFWPMGSWLGAPGGELGARRLGGPVDLRLKAANVSVRALFCRESILGVCCVARDLDPRCRPTLEMKPQRAQSNRLARPRSSSPATPTSEPARAFAMDDPRGSHSVTLLKALHILTRDGQLNQDSRRKLKQVNHLIQLMAGPLFELQGAASQVSTALGEEVSSMAPPMVLVDHGCGKSYLGFMLYEWWGGAKLLRPLEVIGIETRSELVEHAKTLARELNFKGMDFFNISAKEAGVSDLLPQSVSVVTALHACDTASDDAIEFALAKRAQLVFLVPCCQAELAAKLRAGKAKTLAKTPLAELWRHPLHTREMGSQLTNVLRCLYLESQGYKVSVTELVGWEHSLKNELITATYTGQFKRSAALRLMALLEQFGLAGLMPERYPRVQAVLAAACHERAVSSAPGLEEDNIPQAGGVAASTAAALIP